VATAAAPPLRSHSMRFAHGTFGRSAQSSTARTRGVGGGSGPLPTLHTSRSSVSALVGMASLSAKRAPASPPSASPRWPCRSPSRPVRRAAAGAVPDRRSAKACRKQVGLRQRNRRAWTCNVTGRPCQGRSDSGRRCRPWRRSDATPQSGHDAEAWRGLVTTAMWSGLGRTWSTMRPAGIKGSRCLDKKGFQEKAEAPYVLIQPRNDSTGSADEPTPSPVGVMDQASIEAACRRCSARV